MIILDNFAILLRLNLLCAFVLSLSLSLIHSLASNLFRPFSLMCSIHLYFMSFKIIDTRMDSKYTLHALFSLFHFTSSPFSYKYCFILHVIYVLLLCQCFVLLIGVVILLLCSLTGII